MSDMGTWLGRQTELLDSEAGGPHLSDGRLAGVAEGGRALRRGEITHLSRCVLCREVAAAVVEATPAPRPATRWWPRVLILGAAAAAAVALLVLRPPQAPEPWATRGGTPSTFTAPSLTITVEDAAGRRVLTDGARLALGGRMEFRYGNVGAAARTLTVLGWDGRAVHWYYPERAGAPAQPLRGGEEAVGVRLPFDVELDAPHRAGPLTIAIGFDQDPRALADRLAAGAAPPEGVRQLRLLVTPP